jgi:hypothetical protein
MALPEQDFIKRRQIAVNDCHAMIAWYDRNKRIPRNLLYASQVSTIVLGALTPVLILWSDLPKPVQALPAALASIAASLNAVFRWRENWTLRAHTSEALKRELVKFQSRASEEYDANLDDQRALTNFVNRTERLSMDEVSEWRILQLQQPKDSDNIKNR